MSKTILSPCIAVAFSLLFTGCSKPQAEAADAPPPPDIAHAREAEKPGKAPRGFAGLLDLDARGGEVLRPADFDLTKPGAKWQDANGARAVFEQTYDDYGSYRLDIDNPPAPEEAHVKESDHIAREIWSVEGVKVKPNRNYLVSALIKTDFPREAAEFSFSMRFFGPQPGGKSEQRLSPRHLVGAPAVTEGPDGWQRLEWVTTVPSDPNIAEARPSIFLRARHAEKPMQVRVADFAFSELPEVPLPNYAPGEGVTFPGGVGNLPMKVESAVEKDGHIIVETTGARFDFDLAKNRITLGQRMEFSRPLAVWDSSLDLAGLKIEKQSPDVCILSNEHLTVGIQADSMMVLSPHEELTLILTNLLGGDFNRYAWGHLLSLDDFGGITVNPHIPAGTGRTPRSRLLTEGLDFESLAPDKIAQSNPGLTGNIRDYEQTGKAEPGWQAEWKVSPGEFLCSSVFPPRPFPWEESFRSGWTLVRRGSPLSVYEKGKPFVDTWLLWDFVASTWGHSYSDKYEPLDEADLLAHRDAIHKAGGKVIPKIDAYWTPTRDPEVYIAAVREWKEKYGMDGVYSDGLPSEDWMVAYKEMRLLRELFPDGPIVIHNSVPQSGQAISQFMPFVYTYATFTYLVESVKNNQGEDWQYPRYTSSQFRKANALGITKGNNWQDKKGEIMGERRGLVDLVYNGRDHVGFEWPKYNKALSQLHALWKEKGDKPFFYDRYYLPKAQELTGYRIGRAAMPIAELAVRGGIARVKLHTLTPDATIRYTMDGSIPTENSPQYKQPLMLDPEKTPVLKVRAFSPGLDPSAVAVENIRL